MMILMITRGLIGSRAVTTNQLRFEYKLTRDNALYIYSWMFVCVCVLPFWRWRPICRCRPAFSPGPRCRVWPPSGDQSDRHNNNNNHVNNNQINSDKIFIHTRIWARNKISDSGRIARKHWRSPLSSLSVRDENTFLPANNPGEHKERNKTNLPPPLPKKNNNKIIKAKEIGNAGRKKRRKSKEINKPWMCLQAGDNEWGQSWC